MIRLFIGDVQVRPPLSRSRRCWFWIWAPRTWRLLGAVHGARAPSARQRTFATGVAGPLPPT